MMVQFLGLPTPHLNPKALELDVSGLSNALGGIRQQNNIEAAREMKMNALAQQQKNLDRRFKLESDLAPKRLALLDAQVGAQRDRLSFDRQMQPERLRLARAQAENAGNLTKMRQQEFTAQAEAARYQKAGNILNYIQSQPPESQAELWQQAQANPVFAQVFAGAPEGVLADPRAAAAYVGSMLPRQKPIRANAGDVLLDANTYKPIYTAAPKPRKFSFTDIDKLTEEGKQGQDVSRFLSTFNDKFAGYFPGTSGPLLGAARSGFGSDDSIAAAKWWNDYDRYKGQVRSKLYGASLTKSEKDAFEAADIAPDMAPDQVKTNLKRQRDLIAQAMQRRKAALVKAGFDRDTIEQAYGPDMTQPKPQPKPNGPHRPGKYIYNSATNALEPAQ